MLKQQENEWTQEANDLAIAMDTRQSLVTLDSNDCHANPKHYFNKYSKIIHVSVFHHLKSLFLYRSFKP